MTASDTTPTADWVEWSGGENPVPGQVVDVKARSPHSGGVNLYADRLGWSRQYMDDDIIAYRVVSPTPTAASAGEPRRFTHHKRGGEYTLIGNGRVQCSESGLLDDENVVIYRGADGQLWTRRYAEFWDGRFEELPAQPHPSQQAGTEARLTEAENRRVQAALYMVGNPSAWDGYDEGASETIRDLCAMIERLKTSEARG